MCAMALRYAGNSSDRELFAFGNSFRVFSSGALGQKHATFVQQEPRHNLTAAVDTLTIMHDYVSTGRVRSWPQPALAVRALTPSGPRLSTAGSARAARDAHDGTTCVPAEGSSASAAFCAAMGQAGMTCNIKGQCTSVASKKAQGGVGGAATTTTTTTTTPTRIEVVDAVARADDGRDATGPQAKTTPLPRSQPAAPPPSKSIAAGASMFAKPFPGGDAAATSFVPTFEDEISAQDWASAEAQCAGAGLSGAILHACAFDVAATKDTRYVQVGKASASIQAAKETQTTETISPSHSMFLTPVCNGVPDPAKCARSVILAGRPHRAVMQPFHGFSNDVLVLAHADLTHTLRELIRESLYAQLQSRTRFPFQCPCTCAHLAGTRSSQHAHWSATSARPRVAFALPSATARQTQ